MIIRFAEAAEYAAVLEHYAACSYGGGVDESDQVVIVVEDHIIAAVRMCVENEIKVLRGMQIKPEFQRKGIGMAMLAYLKDHIEMNGCYCLPYKHLTKFYGKIGFEEIQPQDAPEFLAARFNKYISDGSREIIIMQIK